MKIIGRYPKTRLRRVRNSDWIRRLISESNLSTNDLILPIFIKEGRNQIEKIKSMPDVYRYTLDKIEKIADKAELLKIPMIALFPYTPANKKTLNGSESFNENNLICKAIRLLKKKKRNIGIMCDVALDPYTSHGHDGLIVDKDVDNDKTIDVLVKQALIQAAEEAKAAAKQQAIHDKALAESIAKEKIAQEKANAQKIMEQAKVDAANAKVQNEDYKMCLMMLIIIVTGGGRHPNVVGFDYFDEEIH